MNHITTWKNIGFHIESYVWFSIVYYVPGVVHQMSFRVVNLLKVDDPISVFLICRVFLIKTSEAFQIILLVSKLRFLIANHNFKISRLGYCLQFFIHKCQVIFIQRKRYHFIFASF